MKFQTIPYKILSFSIFQYCDIYNRFNQDQSNKILFICLLLKIVIILSHLEQFLIFIINNKLTLQSNLSCICK